jgi:hypothetical protein
VIQRDASEDKKTATGAISSGSRIDLEVFAR